MHIQYTKIIAILAIPFPCYQGMPDHCQANLRLLTIESDIFLEHSVLEIRPSDVVYLENSHSYNSHVYFEEAGIRSCIFGDEGFWIVDLGSVKGTFINNERLSPQETASLPKKLKHFDVISIGCTVFEVHFFLEGNFVCSECSDSLCKPAYKFDICNLSGPCSLREKPAENSPIAASSFCMQAKKKRKKNASRSIGSGKLVNSDYGKNIRKRLQDIEAKELQKEEEIRSIPNKGMEILKKIGWKMGSGLGKNEQGNVQPLEIRVKKDKKGIGSGKSINDTKEAL